MAVLTVLVFGIVFLVLIYRVLKRETILQNNNVPSEFQSLKHIPGVPFWSLCLMWWKYSTFVMHIGSIDQICQVRLGKLRMAIINDYKLGKELFQNPVFCGRSISAFFDSYSHGPYGIVNGHGKEWKKQMIFVKQQLKEFGVGTQTMETNIQNEIDVVLQSWRETKGQRFSPNKSFFLPILNALWIIIAGERASTQDKELVPLLHRVYHGAEKITDIPDSLLLFSKVSLENGLKIMKWIPIFSVLQNFLKDAEELRAHFQTKIDARKKAGTISGAPSNFVEAYLKEVEQTKDPNSGFYGKEGNLNLQAIMADLFISGGDTTSSHINWALLHLIRNPDVQQKIRQEIHQVVGRDRLPRIQDRANCPYTEAFNYEVLRVSPFGLLSLPHSTTEDTSVGPYFVEKGTIVYLNIYSIHFDPKIWGDPQNFRPDRFLSEDGRTVIRHETMCAFSLGQRRCPGEYIARDSIFLYISSICQQFILSPDPRVKGIPPLKENRAVALIPDTFYMVATPYSDLEQEENLSNLVNG